MTSSANSIIRVYQEPSNFSTALNTNDSSPNEVISPINSVNDNLSSPDPRTSQAPYSPAKSLPSSFIFNKISNLPTNTAELKDNEVTEPSVIVSCEFENSEVNKSTNGAATGNSTNSFFSIPLRFFSLKSKNEAVSSDIEVLTSSELENTALDVISDSPVGNLIPKDTIDEYLEERDKIENASASIQPESEDSDPLFETYIRYVYHTQDNQTIDSLAGLDGDDDNDVIKFRDSATIVADEDDQEMRDLQNDGQIEQDEISPKTSTLTRIKTKTKRFFKQLSAHYENEFKNFNENSFRPTKNELKRRLSTYSFRPTSSIKRFKLNGYRPNNQYQDQTLDTEGKGILALLESSEFYRRLNQGSVSARRKFNDENEGTYDDDDENYHITYKLNNEYTEEPVKETKSHPFKVFKRLSIKRLYNRNINYDTAF